ncbi:hypothetical protein Tco_1387421, partial [Tanacetum coccineum]
AKAVVFDYLELEATEQSTTPVVEDLLWLRIGGWNFISKARRDASACNLSRWSLMVPLVGTPQELRYQIVLFAV